MSKKIIVVDDERSLNKLLAKALVAKGHEAYSAYNGKDALVKINEIMPRMGPQQLLIDL